MPTDVASNKYTTQLFLVNKAIANAIPVGESSQDVEVVRKQLLDVCKTLREFQKFVIAHVASIGIDAEALQMAGATEGSPLGISTYLLTESK